MSVFICLYFQYKTVNSVKKKVSDHLVDLEPLSKIAAFHTYKDIQLVS